MGLNHEDLIAGAKSKRFFDDEAKPRSARSGPFVSSPGALELPRRGSCSSPNLGRRVGPLGDEPFEAELGARGQRVNGVSVERGDGRPPVTGQGELLEQGTPVAVRKVVAASESMARKGSPCA
ncbi:MAG: hypothetical protein NVS3B21_22710 [Acidimicrobiales bacterium]